MKERQLMADSRKSDRDDDKMTDEAEAAVGDVHQKVAEATEKGYYGHSPDPTPAENYTLDGVTSGKPTPETERKA
jgi:hypothetical protein